jgi:type I restriction enzyme, S subunit
VSFPTKTIREVTETLIDYRGKTPTKTSSGIKLITAKVIKEGFIVDGDHEYIAANQYDSWMRRGLPQQWDVLITTEAPLGEVAQLRTPEKVALAQRVILLRGNSSIIDQAYYFHALKSPVVQRGLKARSSGTTVLGIKQSELWNVEVPCPPLETQKRIASILSAYDDLIENNTWRIKILERMAQMLYREWFVNFHFPGHEKVEIVDSENGQIPEGWRSGILRDTCVSIDYGYTASANSEPVGPKFLRITDIVPDSIDWSSVPYCSLPQQNPAKYKLIEGDVVVARTGATTGYAKRLNKRHPDCVFASYLVRLRISPGNSSHMYGLLVESEEYKRFISANLGGAAQPQANAQVLTSIPIVVPPTSLQTRFSAIVGPLLDEKEILQLKNINLRETRDLLLPKLVSGEVSVEQIESEVPAQTV